ncbi:MAG: hypothetical protein KBD05_02675 [Candidatus Pacebacteria bacterium]|nr:hypothetical protein [Candidatus Paceibacterota bacterium]
MTLRLAIGLVLLLLVLYGAKEAYPLIAGPSIRIDSPIDYATFPDGEVLVSGVASRTETLYLNGGPLLIDQKGNFSTSLTLPQGGAILSVTATDRFGRTRTVRRNVYIPNEINYGGEEEIQDEGGDNGTEGRGDGSGGDEE